MTQEPPLFAEFTGTAPLHKKIDETRPAQSEFRESAPRHLIKIIEEAAPFEGPHHERY
jgi:hypothetical protein